MFGCTAHWALALRWQTTRRRGEEGEASGSLPHGETTNRRDKKQHKGETPTRALPHGESQRRWRREQSTREEHQRRPFRTEKAHEGERREENRENETGKMFGHGLPSPPQVNVRHSEGLWDVWDVDGLNPFQRTS